jgi:hypothetical protein
MPEDYEVKQGDYVSKIAKDKGFMDYKAIWNHPKNASLKQERKSPNLLLPGDSLHIPDKEIREESCSTDSKHTFKAKIEPLKLAIKVQDMTEKPVAGKPCQLRIAGSPDLPNLSTDGDGIVKREIKPDAQNGTLIVRDSNLPVNLSVTLLVGHMDPVKTVTGQKARLNNLAYNAGPVNNIVTLQFKSAVEEFQCDHGITPVTGECNAATQAKLEDVYGC